ncbi:MAG: hypothetical protein EOR60_15010 [Mesorhizobium sp.]|nr:MAG: hypothetical protein EOR60_15010 [Mesorhizobium sp.]
MPRFFFDLSDGEDVYHDASGATLPSFAIAKERALDIVRKLGPRGDKDVICTVRDRDGRSLMKITIEAGKPVVAAREPKKPQR